MPRTGLEPARLSTLAPETSASTIPPPGHCPWAENEARTRDPNLGKVVLYQLSYFRVLLTCQAFDCVVVLFVSLNGCKGIAFFLTSKTFWSFFWRKCKIFAKTPQKGGFWGKKGAFHTKNGHSLRQEIYSASSTCNKKKIDHFTIYFSRKRRFLHREHKKKHIDQIRQWYKSWPNKHNTQR